MNPCPDCGRTFDPHPCLIAGGPLICLDCKVDIAMMTEPHTVEFCLRRQVSNLKAERDAWKDAWFDQRDATGRAAWMYLRTAR